MIRSYSMASASAWRPPTHRQHELHRTAEPAEDSFGGAQSPAAAAAAAIGGEEQGAVEQRGQ